MHGAFDCGRRCCVLLAARSLLTVLAVLSSTVIFDRAADK
nr:MAG TPA: hypothetical protein [Caudoviricetes sp.]